MVEERVTVRDDGETREQTIERSPGPVIVERRSSGFGWMLLLLVVLAVVAGMWFLNQANQRGSAETQAITKAAQDVGQAAGDVADSVGDAVDGDKK